MCCDDRTGKSRLGALNKLIFATSEKHETGDGQGNSSGQQQDARDASDRYHPSAEYVSADTERQGPADSTECIHDQERRPIHTVDAREQRRIGSKYGGESTETYNLASVSVKQILADFKTRLAKA